MARTSVINLDANPQSDGYKLGGGSTKRTLTVTGADMTLTGSGTLVQTMPSLSSFLVGTLTSMTSGSILFSGGSVAVENNSRLFWDNTNFTLGVNTTRTGAISGTNPIFRIKGSGTTSGTSSFEVQNSSGATLFMVRDDGLITGAQTGIQFQDEGVNVGTAGGITTINFTGPELTLTAASTTLTVNSNAVIAFNTAASMGFMSQIF